MMALSSASTQSICWVTGPVIVELKAIKALDSAHAAQCINYLKGDRPAALPVTQFRQVLAARYRALPTAFAASRCICVHLRSSAVEITYLLACLACGGRH
jgi:PD-(D/E)XK nuclease superfamily